MAKVERIVRGGDKGFMGRVSGEDGGGVHLKRMGNIVAWMKETLDGMFPERDLVEDRSDRFSGLLRFEESPDISLENAAAFVVGHEEFEDGEVMTGHEGTVPCDMVGRPRGSKVGKSGRRVWSR